MISRCQSKKAINILYISYDGLMEPLGQSQILQYLKKLSLSNNIYLITYEKFNDLKDESKFNKLKMETENAGIHWIVLRYHKKYKIVSAVYDILLGFVISLFYFYSKKIRIVHARSYIPSVIALFLKYVIDVKFVFDMRGFWADERMTSGQWQEHSQSYLMAKKFERLFFMRSDAIVSLTYAGKKAIEEFSYLAGRDLNIIVIPTCVNTDYFQYDLAKKNSKTHVFTLGCVGSIQGWFQFDSVLLFFSALQKQLPESKLLVITKDNHSYVYERATVHNIKLDSIEAKEVDYLDVPGEMARMDAGIFFYRPAFSEIARSPTKFAEFLASGVPCISNSGIGDVANLIVNEGVGVVIDDFVPNLLAESVQKLIVLARSSDINERCNLAAKRNFLLAQGVNKYNRLYQDLIES